MSRSGYIDDMDDMWQHICWRGAVASAFKGRRGQAFLKEMLAALDALPEKALVANELEQKDGAVCALGAVGKARGIDMSELDPEDRETVASKFGIAAAMAAEIVFTNDEWVYDPTKETTGQRFYRMRQWVESQIIKEPPRV